MNLEIADFDVFDAHLHTYGTFLKTEKDLISYMDKYNVKKAILTTINRKGTAKSFIRTTNSPETDDKGKMEHALENMRKMAQSGQLPHDDVNEIANNAPKRFYKFFWFNPNFNPEEEDGYKILENHFVQRFCGVKIHSAFHFVKIPKDIIKLCEFLQDFDERFVLFIHSTPKYWLFSGISGMDIAKLAKKFPKLRIIVGHAAYSMEYGFETGIVLKSYNNVFFETSCCPALGIFNLVKTVGHERILFGSDAPVTSTLEIELLKILSLPINRAQKQDILYNNTSQLLGGL